MWRWCALLTTRSRIDSATTGFGNSEYQSVAARLAVAMRLLPARSVINS
jgi:hypothetical protein